MNKYIAEFIGTFFLVATIGMTTISPGAGDLAPIAIGSVLMIMIYAGSHVSGAHYNPAVTIAVYLRGRCSMADVVPYIVSQILGAAVAALVVKFFKADALIVASNIDTTKALIAEFLGTFALAYTVLNVATSKDHANNSFYGMAIGFTVVAMAYTFGGVSGGAFNPAAAIGASMLGAFSWANIWIYLLGSIAGGVLAAVVFKMLNPTDK
jgi:aquaporin Z